MSIPAGFRQKDALKYEIVLLMVSVIWGSGFVAQQVGMERGLGPMTFNGLRFALGSVALMPFLWWRSKRSHVSKADSGLPIMGSILAGLFMFAASGLQQIGLQYTTCANAGFITSLYIVFVPLLGLFLGHRAGKSLWLGIVICVMGLYLLSFTNGFKIVVGDLYVLGCAFMWAGQILVIDHAASRGDPLKIAFLQFVVCAVLTLVAALIFETCTIDRLEAATPALLYSGIMSVGIAFTAQVFCQKKCPPGPAAVIMSMEAVFAAIAGYLVLNQTLSPRAVLGCGLILSGLLVVQLVPMLARKSKRVGVLSSEF